MIYLNGRIVPNNRALISVYDHGFLYGDGIYETLRAYGGKVFMLDEHLERLFSSASMIGLMISKKARDIKKAVYMTMAANRLKEAVIRITVSRGAGPIGLDPGLCKRPTFVVFANPFRMYPRSSYEKGVKIIISRTRRNYRKALDPRIKSLNFLNNILAMTEALDQGALEAVMPNYRGCLSEGTVSNIFFVKKGILHTPSPDTGILNGITRRIILDLAWGMKIPIHEGCYRPRDLSAAEEAFISNTTMEVMPVTAVGGRVIGKKAGPVTRRLHGAYRDKVAEYIREANR
ncbi:MAG: aminotransferase class IV [Nitrospiraceae bacterium]|nr:MAG: aminotransferase class IV [Nitrospiraceae bacterium]